VWLRAITGSAPSGSFFTVCSGETASNRNLRESGNKNPVGNRLYRLRRLMQRGGVDRLAALCRQ
jgi:hypothetical protein